MMERHRLNMIAVPKALIEDKSLSCYQRIINLRLATLKDAEEIPLDLFAMDLCCSKDEIEQIIKSLVIVGWLSENENGDIGINVVKGGYNEEDEYIL